MKEIKVGLVGFGTVGAGVVEGLIKENTLLANRAGVQMTLAGIADLDITTDRGITVPAGLLTTDAMGLINNPEIDVIVELIGGTGFAYTVIKAALSAGKSVVTANKKLIAEKGPELFALAAEKGVDLYFGASVGGGIPIIRSLRDGLISNEIEAIYGILNGTCNYILTRMEREGLPFDEILSDAQRLGYAEADPSLDIDGFDTAHKIAILAALSYGIEIPMDQLLVEGIRGLEGIDVKYADELGYRIKLLAVCKRIGTELEVRVHPTLVPKDHMLASVSEVFNAAMVTGNMTGDTLYYGKGAGREATASAVISDIASEARHIAHGNARFAEPFVDAQKTVYSLRKAEDCVSRFYIRLMVRDKVGMVGQFATILGNHGVSLVAASQHELVKESQQQGAVPVVILTQPAATKDIELALQEIIACDIVDQQPIYMRTL